MTHRSRMEGLPSTSAAFLTQPEAFRLLYVERRQLRQAPRTKHRDQMQPNDLTIAVQRAIGHCRFTVISEPALQVLRNGDAPRFHECARIQGAANLALATLRVPFGSAD